MGKNRRGSSTRKHKLPQENTSRQAKLPFKPAKEAATTVVTQSKQERMIVKLTSQLRAGKDDKGKTLTDQDITKKLTTISNLEQKLGIVHTE